MMWNEPKAIQGRAYTFTCVPPTRPSDDVTLEVAFDSEAFTATMTPVRAAADIQGLSSDRRTVHIYSNGLGFKGLMGPDGGQARVVLGAGSAPIPVTLVSIDDTGACVTLAAPLPREVRFPVQGAKLEWATYTAVIPAERLTTTQRNVPWSVRWAARAGDDAPNYEESLDGVLHVVKRPFRTGLTHAGLLALVPALARALPKGQTSWHPQIDLAEGELVGRLRDVLQERYGSVYEDDVPGGRFTTAHAYLTASLIAGGQVMGARGIEDARDDYEAMAAKAINRALKGVWIDLDRDGQVDEGESVGALGFTGAAGGAFTDEAVAEWDSHSAWEDR